MESEELPVSANPVKSDHHLIFLAVTLLNQS